MTPLSQIALNGEFWGSLRLIWLNRFIICFCGVCDFCERRLHLAAVAGRIAIRPYRSMSNAIGDGKPCLTAGKPQSGVACGKKATINMCLEVAQHRSTSSTPIYCVGFLLRRFRYATPAVKHSEAPSALFSQNMPISWFSAILTARAVTSCITPHWRRRRLCGGSRTHPSIHNRGAVAGAVAMQS